ncbi:PucR family transcriptional regulator [Streptomyces pseudovenezuelae]|uniref:PucR C-terminal helix-turn-helix domain-containing protein n=1 Tax=Streptomyces pseudovenezuelae TaxID=67350 RepID=A0ABT6M323_9ACTN|nr:helix-turn-helix domain-containing protein [Streptomyces pseudovenezuelae]MDH6222401.1 hypothetical protein [Streptomyces pseudovenezuelae]
MTGLTELPRAVTLATAAARVLPPEATEPHRLEDSWLDVLVHRAGDLGRDLAGDVFGGLHAGAPPAEADHLLWTVQVHLSGSGSLADTAAALYCHRNTIQQRLNRFAELTGRDPRRPEGAALVVLALSVNRLGRRDAGGPDFADLMLARRAAGPDGVQYLNRRVSVVPAWAGTRGLSPLSSRTAVSRGRRPSAVSTAAARSAPSAQGSSSVTPERPVATTPPTCRWLMEGRSVAGGRGRTRGDVRPGLQGEGKRGQGKRRRTAGLTAQATPPTARATRP